MRSVVCLLALSACSYTTVVEVAATDADAHDAANEAPADVRVGVAGDVASVDVASVFDVATLDAAAEAHDANGAYDAPPAAPIACCVMSATKPGVTSSITYCGCNPSVTGATIEFASTGGSQTQCQADLVPSDAVVVTPVGSIHGTVCFVITSANTYEGRAL